MDLSALVAETTQALCKQAEAGSVAVSASVEPGWHIAGGDPALVSQILLNLVLNAIEAAPPGSTVNVRLSGKGSQAELVVEAAGIGIPAELRERVFEPFFTTRQKGTGLGLAIVRKAVNHLGGSIELDSPIAGERGTRFRVVVGVAEQRKEVNAAAG